MTVADLARLVRLPLVVTALFDPVAGLYLVGGASLLPCLGVAAASACLYLGGMALNDVFDEVFDRVHHPDRVLPTRRVSPRLALSIGATLLTAGVAVAALVRPSCAACALGVAVLIVLYDGCLKRRGLLGPLVMGACRGGSLLIGGFAAPDAPALSPAVWIAAGSLASYVAAVTWVSRLEEAEGEVARSRVRARFAPGLLALLVLPGIAAHPLAAAAPLGVLYLVTLGPGAGPARPLTRREVMGRVGVGVRGILLVDVALLWGAGGFALGATALGFYLFASAWSRARRR